MFAATGYQGCTSLLVHHPALPGGELCFELGSFDGRAAWSPDGRQVAFLKGMRQLAVTAADGSGSRDLPVHPSGGFVWAPDATRFATIDPSGENIIDALTGERLATSGTIDQSYPVQVHYPSWQRVARAGP